MNLTNHSFQLLNYPNKYLTIHQLYHISKILARIVIEIVQFLLIILI
jgi:hypothetical protein